MNLGIPHFRIQNILAMARAELPALDPDLITLYAGYNNSMVVEDRERRLGRLSDEGLALLPLRLLSSPASAGENGATSS